MRNSDEIKNLIAKSNKDRNNTTFAEFIAELFKDKYIEVYLGDSFEEVSVEQISTSYAAVFCGKVMGAFKECLILNSFYETADKKGIKTQSHGNIVFISERSIRSLVEIDGNGTINDLFVKSGSESNKIKYYDGDKKS